MKVLTANALASIQDSGRVGYRSQGVGRNGVMDQWAFQAGNALVKNDLNEPAIEIALGNLTVTFENEVSFCITGALYEAYLDEQRIPCYWRIAAQAGQTLKLVRPIQGTYAYLCVHGGFDIAPVMQSASTNAKAGFGGYQGRYLQALDTINIKTSSALPIIGITSLAATDCIRVIKNSEYDCFTTESLANFESQPWQVQSSSNRMGYRLQGTVALEPIESMQMSSHGVDIGMIQVPPQGQPIVLMADAQTTGGYPKIATIIQADIGLMAQTRLGQSCKFTIVSLQQALQARQARHLYIERIRRYAHEN